MQQLMKQVLKNQTKTIRTVMEVHRKAADATGSPVAKMSSGRAEWLVALAGHEEDLESFVQPRIYVELEKSGWTKDAIQASLRRLCAPNNSGRHRSNVTISNKLVLTFKSGDLSNNNDCTYEGCRGGITPWAVPPLSYEAAGEDILEYQAFEAATHRRAESRCKARK